MVYQRIAGLDDVQPGQIKAVDAGGIKMLLANVDGSYRVAARKCPHMGANLAKGKLDGNSVVCPFHTAKFNLDTGAVERDPKLLFIKMKAKRPLAIFTVRVEGEDILVDV